MHPQLPSDLEQHAGRVVHVAERDEDGCVWFCRVRGAILVYCVRKGISNLCERGARERGREGNYGGGWGGGHKCSGQHVAILFASEEERGRLGRRV